MWNTLLKINKHLIIAIPLFLIAGFIFGVFADKALTRSMKALILPLTFLMVYPMMVTLNIQHLRKGLDIKLQVTTQFINFAVIPFVAFFFGAAMRFGTFRDVFIFKIFLAGWPHGHPWLAQGHT